MLQISFTHAAPAESRYRVVATLREGMTAADALDPHPGPADPPVPFDRLVSVLGASREIPTAPAQRGQGRRQHHLVAADQPQHRAGHRGGSTSLLRTRAAS